MRFDAIVAGGGFAGLAAAMQLARARRQVAVVDAGQPRNRFSAALHGMPGQDGRTPAAILGEARAQLAAYPAATLIGGQVATAAATGDGFLVQLADGREMTAARPDMVAHALLFTDWGPTTLLLDGIPAPDAETAARLAAAGITIETVPVVELLGPAPGLAGLRLADGRTLPMTGLFVAPEPRFTTPPARHARLPHRNRPHRPLDRDRRLGSDLGSGRLCRRRHRLSDAQCQPGPGLGRTGGGGRASVAGVRGRRVIHLPGVNGNDNRRSSGCDDNHCDPARRHGPAGAPSAPTAAQAWRMPPRRPPMPQATPKRAVPGRETQQ